jgi:hypothetical protein
LFCCVHVLSHFTSHILFQPGDELVSVDGVPVAGFSFARVRSAVVGAMGSVVELQVIICFVLSDYQFLFAIRYLIPPIVAASQ